MKETLKPDFVSVAREYLQELEEKKQTSDWQRGYIAGIEDGIGYAERLIQAARSEE